MVKTNFVRILFQCDRLISIEHRYNERKNVTVCGLKPSRSQWEAGTMAYEHGYMHVEIKCNICLPPAL